MDVLVSAGWTDAFRDTRVLVTGDTGFKGAWLCAWLDRLGAKVVGFALPPEGEDPLFARLKLVDRIEHHDGDLRDSGAVSRVVDAARPDVVFHLAAQSLVLRGYREPKMTFETNVCGSVNLLEAVRARPKIRALVYATSDKCYRDPAAGNREEDSLGGDDPYSASKAAAEMVLAAYRQAYFADGPGAASVRAGNVIGGGDWADDRIVPDCIRALSEGRPIALRNPGAVRPWQHVLEPLCGYLMLATRLLDSPSEYAEAWNFGPDRNDVRTVRQLADRVIAGWGAGSVETPSIADAPHEAPALYLDSTKARGKLEWRPAWAFDRAVAETVGWYRSVLEGESAERVTAAQIEKYMESACD